MKSVFSMVSAVPPWGRVAVGTTAVLLVVALAFVIWARPSAGRAVDEYSSKVAAWRADTGATLAESGTTVPKGLYEFDDPSTDRSLAALRAQCEELKRTASELDEELAVKPPMIRKVRLGILSSEYRQTKDQAQRLAGQVDQFQKGSAEAMAQFGRDCEYLVGISTADGRVRRAADALKARGLRGGEQFVLEGRVYGCPKSATCAPTKQEFRQFAQAFRESVAVKRARANIDSTPQCAATVLEKQMCQSALTGWTSAVKAETTYVDAVIASGGQPTSAEAKKLDTLYKQMNAAYDKAGKSFGEATTDKWPRLRDVAGYPPADISEYYTIYLLTRDRLAQLRADAGDLS